MLRTWRQTLLDLACQLPSWAFLAAGLAIIALTLLIPAYLKNRELVWQRDLQKLQAQRMAEQEQAYRQMIAAIDAGDPMLIQRLAYHYLRLKPAGTNILAYRPATADGRGYAPPVAIAERYTTAETWLQRPLPRVGVDYPRYSPVESFVVRVVTSPVRGVLLAAGLLSLGLSFIPIDRRRRWQPKYSVPMPPLSRPVVEIGTSTVLAAPKVVDALTADRADSAATPEGGAVTGTLTTPSVASESPKAVAPPSSTEADAATNADATVAIATAAEDVPQAEASPTIGPPADIA